MTVAGHQGGVGARLAVERAGSFAAVSFEGDLTEDGVGLLEAVIESCLSGNVSRIQLGLDQVGDLALEGVQVQAASLARCHQAGIDLEVLGGPVTEDVLVSFFPYLERVGDSHIFALTTAAAHITSG